MSSSLIPSTNKEQWGTLVVQNRFALLKITLNIHSDYAQVIAVLSCK